MEIADDIGATAENRAIVPLLRQELANPKYRCDVMAIGTNTDAYQPVERELKIMRSILDRKSVV